MTDIDVRQARAYELGPGQTAWPTVALFCLALAAQLASAALLPAPLAILVCAAAAYSQFTVVHDAAHRSVSRRPWLNEALGTAAAFVLCGPFVPFRDNHLRHHARTNDPQNDPDYWVAGRTALGTALRCATLLEYHYWVYFTRRAKLDGTLARAAATLGAMGALLLLAAFFGRAGALALYWLLPAQLAGAALGLLFDYWPHRPHTGRGRLKDTAVIAPRWLDPLFLSQNIHLLHHLFPTIPWYRYRPAFRRLEPGLRREKAIIWDLRQALKMLRTA